MVSEKEIREKYKVGQYYKCGSLYYLCYEKEILLKELWNTRLSRYSHFNFVDQRRKILEGWIGMKISIIAPSQMFLIVEHSDMPFCFEKSMKVLHSGGVGYIYPFNTLEPQFNANELNINEMEIYPVFL